MSDHVAQIRSGLETQAATTLGATWQVMNRIYAPEENNFRSGQKSYGVRFLAADPVDTILRTYTVRHFVQILLAQQVVDRRDDTDLQTVIDDLYDQGDELLQAIMSSKISLPLIVMNIDSQSFSEPEIFDNSIVLLRVGFGVIYRSTIA